jgi:hypothetical protein
MCQAYEAERAFVVSCEERQHRAGYLAHLQGEPITAMPPRMFCSEQEAWQHGWACREDGIIPWCIQRELRTRPDGEVDYSIRSTDTDLADKFVTRRKPEVPKQVAGLKRNFSRYEAPDDPHFVDMES